VRYERAAEHERYGGVEERKGKRRREEREIGWATIVLEDVVLIGARGLHDGTSNLRQRTAQCTGHLVRHYVQRRVFHFGDHERVTGRQGVDVEEGVDVLVLVDLEGRDFARHDLLEEVVEERHRVEGPRRL
jgi:hypothetical protein